MAEFNNLLNVKLPLPVHLCFPQHPNSLRVYELIKRRDIRGVVGEVQEQADVVHGTVLLKVGLEEPGRLHVHLVKKRNMMIVLKSSSSCKLQTVTDVFVHTRAVKRAVNVTLSG